MLGRVNNFTQSAITFLAESAETASRYPAQTLIGTVTGFVGGATFAAVYLSSEPPEQRRMIIAALENIRVTYNCAVSLPQEIRNVEFKCDDLFIQDQAQSEAKKAIDDVKGTELAEVGSMFAVALASMVGGGALGFFATTTSFKVKEKLAALAEERRAREEAELAEAGLRASKQA